MKQVIIVTIFILLSGQANHPSTSSIMAYQTHAKKFQPRELKNLPLPIIRALEARKCLIPQSGYHAKLENVISGSFRIPGQKDWAVLCSRNEMSSILIFWNGSATGITEIVPLKDAENCYRGISAVGRAYILHHHESYGGPKPPSIKHQGIDDGFCEKASIVRYLYRGRWLELQGAD